MEKTQKHEGSWRTENAGLGQLVPKIKALQWEAVDVSLLKPTDSDSPI